MRRAVIPYLVFAQSDQFLSNMDLALFGYVARAANETY